MQNVKSDWLAIGQIFSAYGLNDGIGFQILAAMTHPDNRFIGQRLLKHRPAAVTGAEVEDFLEELFDAHGQPRLGVVVSESVWRGSHEMGRTASLRARKKFLQLHGIILPPMDEFGREQLETEMRARGLVLLWKESDLPPSVG